ncbi:DUF6286 domain-containing protein [Naumannella huperziae]
MARSSMIRHAQRRTPAIIVAVLLAGLGFVAAWAGIEASITRNLPSWLAWLPQRLQDTSWFSPSIIVASVLAVLLGLLLIVLAVKPGATSALAVRPPQDPEAIASSDVALARSALARISGARAAQIDGVDGVSVSAGARSVRLSVKTAAADPTAVRTAVTEQVQERLDGIGFVRTPKVSTTARRTA